MPKQLLFSEAARSAILAGVSQLTDAVKATLFFAYSGRGLRDWPIIRLAAG